MTNNDYVVDWILPTGVTLAQAQAHPGAQNTFPQTLTTKATEPCGIVIQEDHYRSDPSVLGTTLDWVNGQPEDHLIVTSWSFFETPACVAVTPTPSPSPTPTPSPTPPVIITEIGTPVYNPPVELAQTGANAWGLGAEFLMALGIIAVGAGLVWRRYAKNG